MQTRLPTNFLNTASGRKADQILRSCVHCGFCIATCPTYLLTGNELDSPRGRIYLVKELLEKGVAGKNTQMHLDACLTCQSCETTCPSNVHYHELLNIGRSELEKTVPRSWWALLKTTILLGILSGKHFFPMLVSLANSFRLLLPLSLARQIPRKASAYVVQSNIADHKRKVILLDGCMQRVLSPDINNAAAMVLDRLAIRSVRIRQETCCGAMHYHTHAQDFGLAKAKNLVDQITDALADGAEAVISTTSGCGNFIKEYGKIFLEEKEYQEKALSIQPYIKDISEFLQQENLASLHSAGSDTLAFHMPCTLSHGQKLGAVTKNILQKLGFDVPEISNSHICCGSAGTYSIFHSQTASLLRTMKIESLEESGGNLIATANIGCQCHLAAGTDKPVKHWIEYVANSLVN